MFFGAIFMMIAPEIMLGCVGLPVQGRPLVIMAAFMLLALSIYYLAMSNIPEALPLWRMTTIVRIMALPLGGIFVFIDALPSIVLIFIGVDALSGLCTAIAIKSELSDPLKRV